MLLPAYVLHQWDWSETSLVVDLFTREHGRVAVVAKGAKRPTSQLRPVLLPFQALRVGLSRPRAPRPGDGGDTDDEVLVLKAAEYAGGGVVLAPARLGAGFHANELLLRLLPRGDPHEGLFDAYADLLQALARAVTDDAVAVALRAFELQLLRAAGLLPALDRDTVTQQPLQPARHYRLDAQAGLMGLGAAWDSAAPAAAGLPGALCSALARHLDDGHRLRATLAAASASDAQAVAALKAQLRDLLVYHAGAHRLRTRPLMRQAQALIQAGGRPGDPADPSMAGAGPAEPAPTDPP